MKVIITNDSLDSLLSVQISTNGGQSYSTYSVSSLKDGLTFDCSPKDLKVICDVNTLKYIQVLADGEKASSSDIDLSGYIKIKDLYFHCYENPFYNRSSPDYDYLSDDEREEFYKMSNLEQELYRRSSMKYYGYIEGYNYFDCLSQDIYLGNNRFEDFLHNSFYEDDKNYYEIENIDLEYYDESELSGFLTVSNSSTYLSESNSGVFITNARVHIIKHF